MVPILIIVAILLSIWGMLKLKGVELSIEQLMEVLPTVVALSLFATAGMLVNLLPNQWQEYKRKNKN